ncbi:MAG: helix-turn-helix domain-containing protein [Saccharospirillum sp.]|jgi:transcriptional regulator with XRE-family HTH domain
MAFAARLRFLIGEGSVSDFARQVGLGESLVRKYLKGSEPSLTRAYQIAQRCRCSLEWLASGQGYPYRRSEMVDLAAMQSALSIISKEPEMASMTLPDEDTLIRMVAVYQLLSTTKLRTGDLDEQQAKEFADFLKEPEHLSAFKAERVL